MRTPLFYELLSKKHGVPKSTLHDRISGKVSHGDKPGPKPLLSAVEEGEFANFLVEVAQAGYGKTRKEVRYIAGSVDVTENNRGEGEIRATVSADVTENNGGEGDLRAMLTAHEAENTEVESELRATLTAADRIENTVVERDDKNATGDQSHNLRYISKYLVQFVPDAKPQKTETSVRISGARVLTSEKCVSILKEHEEKRKQQEEEKEKKKIERE